MFRFRDQESVTLRRMRGYRVKSPNGTVIFVADIDEVLSIIKEYGHPFKWVNDNVVVFLPDNILELEVIKSDIGFNPTSPVFI